MKLSQTLYLVSILNLERRVGKISVSDFLALSINHTEHKKHGQNRGVATSVLDSHSETLLQY